MTTKPAASGKKQKLISVHLLDGGEHVVCVDVKSKFQEVFNQITGHLSLRETEYFGLAFKKDNEYQFVVLDEKIHKHAPKQWKSGPGDGVDSQGKPIVSVWFRVQFYVDQVILLREKVTRHQYYLQLKDNVLQYNHLYSEDKCIQLAAYALQADFGNFVRDKHESGYFNPALYFPPWILERHGVEYLAQNMPALHRDLHNMTKNDAELRYIKNASMPPGALNLHFYMVRRRKTDKTCNTWLAICARGVEVYEDDAGYKNHVSTFMWKDIGKLYFDKKKFEIRSVQSSGGRRFIYYTDCDVKSKYLLSICRSTHMFQMAIQPKLMEIQHLDNEDQKRYRESYISNDPRERSHFQHSPSLSVSASASSNNNQRLSVVSDASSNTTSGIVSDRMVASFDDGDDHTREIMIDCPPRLPRQMRSKLQLFSGFNYSPHINSQASPGHNFEVGNVEGTGASAQEITPNVGSGSWRTRHPQPPGCMLGTTGLPLPSPTAHTLDSKPCLVGMNVGHKENYGKLLHGSLLQTGDRNTSGDSAVSVSGIFAGPDKMATLSLLTPSEQQPLNVVTGEGATPITHTYGRGHTVSPVFSLTPPLNQLTKNVQGSSQPPSLNLTTSSASKVPPPKVPSPDASVEVSEHYKPVIMGQQYKSFNSQPDITQKLNSSRTDTPHEYGKTLASTRHGSEHLHYSAANSPQDVNMMSKPLVSQPDIPKEQLKLSAPARGVHSFPNAKAEGIFLPHADGILQVCQGGLATLSSGPSRNLHPLSDVPFNTDAVHHLVTAQVHQPAEPQPTQVPQTATEHYLLALQQGSEVSNQKGAKQLNEPHHNAVVHVQDHGHETQYQPIQNEQQLQCEHKPHTVSSWSQVKPVESDVVKEMDENKENMYQRDKNVDERKAQIDALQSHGKASLHPELKQILGQTHAFSLPLMTALCNDSTLMQASRSQSGSRSSYDTSTVRSTDSRLTRFSHDTDSRRWSSCCQTANMPEVMMSVQSSRPYSWHSEHFELDSQLVLPSADHLAPTTPPNPRNINNKHLSMLNNHQNVLPQKMIVSDPGPASPRMLTMGGETYWWDAPPSAGEIEGITPSWAEMIPYSLPMHHPLSKHEGCGGSQPLNHQHMVPHKLSSGGHRDSETSIAHTQIMKENIGIA